MDKIDPFNSNTFFSKSGNAVNKNWLQAEDTSGNKAF